MLTEREWLDIGYSKGLIDTSARIQITLVELFEVWIAHKETPTNADNIKRIRASWRAYYINEPLSQPIIESALSDLTSAQLREWAESLLKKHYPVDRKKFARMFGIIKQCMEYACDEDVNFIGVNQWEKAKNKINSKLICNKPTPLDEEQIFTDIERRKIYNMVLADLAKYQKQPTSAGLQILFLFETGLRIGECCGLRWGDIRGNYLVVSRQANNDGVKEWTKTKRGYREVPLTNFAQEILGMVKEYNEIHGYIKRDWIFQGNNPQYDYRLSYHSASRKLVKLCARLETASKSPHKCRKTCISALLDSPDINNRTVQRFAGHSDISTTYKYYSFERKSKEEQLMLIDKALRIC